MPGSDLAAKLITPEYLADQVWLHGRGGDYGRSGDKWASTIESLVRNMRMDSVLDYGCGKGALGVALRAKGITCREYDPAIPGKDMLPEAADMVACTDVLEHVEPACIDAVLDHLCGLARKTMFLTVSTRLAGKTLPDGRNAHILLQHEGWWRFQLERRGFRPIQHWPTHDGEWVAVLRC